MTNDIDVTKSQAPQVNTPSADPANYNSLTGAFVEILKKNNQSLAGMLPAAIVTFDRTTNRATVQPLINIRGTSGRQTPRAPIENVPVYQFGGANCMINCNLHPGDLGWIKANDRDISNFSESYKQSNPETNRIKSFSDGVFFPNMLTDYTISEEDTDRLVIQSRDSLTKITIDPSGTITISAPNVIIEADTAQITTEACQITSPSVMIEAESGVEVTTPVFAVVGNITATGTITPGG